MKKEIKNETIKIRVTPKEKNKLKKLSESNKLTLSNYMLEMSLCDKPNTLLPSERIRLINFINEVYHEVKKSNDNQLKNVIYDLYRKNFKLIREEN